MIDIVRATVQVETPQRARDVGTALVREAALARTKNGHSLEVSRAPGGYRDQKFNVAVGADLPIGRVDMLCEVQVLLLEYVRVKLKMHAVYRVHRGDFGGMS